MNDQPKRPPRMSRPMGKDSSAGLLMTFIRSLTASRDPDERDREKANLEKQYQKSDALLDALIEDHHSDLMTAMNIYSSVSTALKSKAESLKRQRENLENARDMLRLDLTELKKLLVEILETKYVSEMLEEYENVSRVPETINELLEKKRYLHATKLLIKSINTLVKDLQQVDSLRTLRADLMNKKEQIYSIIIDEIHRHVYIRSSGGILKKFKRTASERKHWTNDARDTPSRKVSVVDILSPTLMQNTGLPKRSQNFTSQTDLDHDLDIIEDMNDPDPESDSRHFIAILIECLYLLKKIPEAVEAIKERTEKELVNVVKRTAREILGTSSHDNSTTSVKNFDGPITVSMKCSLILENENHPVRSLQELCELLFQQFRSIVSIHENILLPSLKKATIKGEFQETIEFYNIVDIWCKVQAVLQMITDLYLDISGANSHEKNFSLMSQENKIISHASPSLADLNSYFLRKRPALSVGVGNFNKIKKMPLFKFDSSSHAMSLNAYLQEQKEAMKERAEKSGANTLDSIDMSLSETDQYIVCRPAPENIVIMFNSMIKIILDIDDELNLEENNHCPLYSYLISCGKLFLSQVKNDLDRTLDSANKSLEALRVISDTDLQAKRNQSRPILQSVVIIERTSKDLNNLIFAIPIFADEFLTSMCNLLSNYKEICSSAYRGIVQPESEDKRIISANWAKDEDISRLLKDLPNWPTSQKVMRDGHSKKLSSIGSSMTFDESPELIRERNKKESDILIRNIPQDTLIPQHEILSDITHLKSLGQLQESMEWLSNRIFDLSTSLSKYQGDSSGNTLTASPMQIRSNLKNQPELSQLSEISLTALKQLSRKFEELAETCLIVLHLEVRVHCFYHLSRVTRGNFAPGVEAQEPDDEVVKLNKDLSRIDEVLSLSMQSWKLKYVFEGVSHLVAAILINNVSSIERINHNGVKKMCRDIFAIQQTLTSITLSREVALDYARQFYELFYSSPEEILRLIEERGPQFQAQEYHWALELLYRSCPGRDQAKLKANKQRLDEILNQTAVSV